MILLKNFISINLKRMLKQYSNSFSYVLLLCNSNCDSVQLICNINFAEEVRTLSVSKDFDSSIPLNANIFLISLKCQYLFFISSSSLENENTNHRCVLQARTGH